MGLLCLSLSLAIGMYRRGLLPKTRKLKLFEIGIGNGRYASVRMLCLLLVQLIQALTLEVLRGVGWADIICLNKGSPQFKTWAYMGAFSFRGNILQRVELC